MNAARRSTLLAWLALALLVSACSSAGQPVHLDLRTLNGSGVSGEVTLTPIGASRVRVEIAVEPAGHPNMPAHIHPGTCDELVPQPKYPLENVVGGHSVTEVAVSVEELLADTLALNLHASNEEMELYTACVEIR